LQKQLPYFADGSSASATAANLNQRVYAATKGAFNKIAQIAANELFGRNIRVATESLLSVLTEGLLNLRM
jgi:NADP-dependent 3-hydroxy acid dehydrogenase YdfG